MKINALSKSAHDVIVKRFGINRDTSAKGWLYRISTLWRKAVKATEDEECKRFIYSELELVLADIILVTIAALRSLGVNNIENLIRRRLDEIDRENKLKK